MSLPVVIILARPEEQAALAEAVRDIGVQLSSVGSLDETLRALDAHPLAIVLSDSLVATEVNQYVRRIRVVLPRLPVLVLTNEGLDENPYQPIADELERLIIALEGSQPDEPEPPRPAPTEVFRPAPAATEVLPSFTPEPTQALRPPLPGNVEDDFDLLRADALFQPELLDVAEAVVTRVMKATFDDRPMIARHIEEALSHNDRPLFPDALPAQPEVEYDDILSDIDLSDLGVGTGDEEESLARSISEVVAPLHSAETELDSDATVVPRVTTNASGALPDRDVARLFGELIGSAFSGSVKLSRVGCKREFVIEDGALVAVSTSTPSDHIAAVLYRKGRIGPSAHAELRARHEASPLAALYQLAQKQLIDASGIASLLELHLEELFVATLGWEHATFVVQDADVTTERVSLSRDTTQLLIEGVRRKYGMPRLLRNFGSENFVLVRAGAEAPTLKAAQLATLALFDGSRAIAEVAAMITAPKVETYALFWALYSLGLLQPAGEPLPHRVSGSPSAEQSEAVVKREVAAKAEQLADASYFDVLEVPVDATADEISASHAELAAHFGSTQAAELHDKLADIRRVVDEAAEILSDPQAHESYRAHIDATEDDA
jgi:hypothetical protein